MRKSAVMAAAAAAMMSGGLLADTISIVADRDNTLWQRPDDGSLSSGAGPTLFTGRSGYAIAPLRRAVVHFNVSSVPAGATITGATLRMYCSRTHFSASNVTVNRLLQNWGEGESYGGGGGAGSMPNDATWIHTMYPDQFWTTPGGTFASTVSATTLVGGEGVTYQWSGAGMVSDVAGWLADATQNFGWILRGTEGSSRSARQWASREWDDPALRPTLVITYTIPGAGTGVVGAAGLLLLGRRRRG